jgi:hypothetical protein
MSRDQEPVAALLPPGGAFRRCDAVAVKSMN